MNTSERMFLMAADEMNFTRAADKAYISQQAMSNHIRKLEESLDTKLFVRNPKLKLTKAGELYYTALRKIERIEKYSRDAIADNSAEVHGHIRLGIHVDRARMVFPAVFPEFHDLYPNVSVSLINGHTDDFLEMLDRGQIDLMIGHDTPVEDEMVSETMFHEGILLLATRRYLADHHLDGREVIDPHELLRLSLTSTSFNCAVMDHLKRFFIRQQVSPHYLCEVVDYTTQLILCRNHRTAFFCPESYLMQPVFQESMSLPGDDRVLAVPVRGLDTRIHVALVRRKEEYEPRYLREFREMLFEKYRSYSLLVKT